MGVCSQRRARAALPVRVLLDHLVDFEQEGVVAEGAAHALLVQAELGGGDGLALGDLRQVELVLFVLGPPRGGLPLRCEMEKTQQRGRA